MYKTEQEIFSQHESLKMTFDYILKNQNKIEDYIKDLKGITWIGSGSSYCLCKSAEFSTKKRMEIKTNSIAAGDLMMNFVEYEKIIKDTIIIVTSRSGSTSEIISSVKKAKKEYGTPCICLCTVKNSPISKYADLTLEIPWAFDESVCQTRTVTNLYTANLLIIAILNRDEQLIKDIGHAIDDQERFIDDNKKVMEEAAKLKWDNVVILADTEMEGIAEEGAMAFKEICQLKSNYYHILDSRHGPMVLFDDKTMVIIAKTPFDDEHQNNLIKDIKKKGSYVICVSEKETGMEYADINIKIDQYINYSVNGIPFIFIPQALSFYKAVDINVDPDKPSGLDPWIKL